MCDGNDGELLVVAELASGTGAHDKGGIRIQNNIRLVWLVIIGMLIKLQPELEVILLPVATHVRNVPLSI